MKKIFSIKKSKKRPYEIYNFDNSSTGIYGISIPAGITTADFYGISGGAGGGGAFVSRTGIAFTQCNDYFVSIPNGAAYSSTAESVSFNLFKNLITDVVYNGSNTYLISCNGGLLYKSTDELSTFQSVPSPTTRNIISLLWYNNQYFVYDSNYDIWRSSDLLNWTQGTNAGVNGGLNNYDGKIVVSLAKYSTDNGNTWTSISLPPTPFSIGFSSTFNLWYVPGRFGLYYSSSIVGVAWTNLGIWGNDFQTNEATYQDVNGHFYMNNIGSRYTSTGTAFTATSSPFKWVYFNGTDYIFMNGTDGRIYKSSLPSLASPTLLNGEFQNTFRSPFRALAFGNSQDGQLTIGNDKLIIHGFGNSNNNSENYNIFSYTQASGSASTWTGIGVVCHASGASGVNPGLVRVGTGNSGGSGANRSGGGAGGFSGVGGTAASSYGSSGFNGSGSVAGGGGGGGSTLVTFYYRGGTGGGFSLSDITFSTPGLGTAGVGTAGFYTLNQNAFGSSGVGITNLYGGGGNTFETTGLPGNADFSYDTVPWRSLQNYGSAWGDRNAAMTLRTKFSWQSGGNWSQNRTGWKSNKVNNSNEILVSNRTNTFVITPTSHASNVSAGGGPFLSLEGARSGIGTYVFVSGTIDGTSPTIPQRISVGSTWSSVTNIGFTDFSPRSIIFDTLTDKFISVGSGTTYPIWTANNNGTNWLASTSIVGGTLSSIVSLGNTFVAVGTAGSAYYSSDGGNNWSSINLNTSSTLCVSAGTTNFVAVASGVGTGIWISTNATATSWSRKSWREIFPNNSIFPNDTTSMTVFGISHSGNYYGILCNLDSCGRWLWSDDGNNWYAGNDVGIPTSLSATSGARGTARLLFYP